MSDAPDLGPVREALVEAGEPDPGELEATAIPGGASRELWALSGKYVLRRDPVGETPQTSRLAEFAVQRAAFEAGVPVPRPIVCEEAGGRFGTAGMVMAYVAGESIPRRVLRGGTLRAHELGAALRSLRSVDVASLPAVEPDDPVQTTRTMLDATGEALPALELGLRWLERERPEAGAPGVVHGDYRLGNFIVGEDGLAAIVDWEFWHLGDPVEDLAWVCARPWRFGADERVAAGVGSLDELLVGYGEEVDPARLRWWDVMSQAKWAAYCAQQAALRREGAHTSLERTVLARRVAEAEWDMLELMEAA